MISKFEINTKFKDIAFLIELGGSSKSSKVFNEFYKFFGFIGCSDEED